MLYSARLITEAKTAGYLLHNVFVLRTVHLEKCVLYYMVIFLFQGLRQQQRTLTFPLHTPVSEYSTVFFSTVNNGVVERAGLRAYLRLAMRLLLRPIPRHFSKCGAKREAAMLRLQLGHTHSLFFHWLYTWPKTSNPGWSTISEKWKKKKSLIPSVSGRKTFSETVDLFIFVDWVCVLKSEGKYSPKSLMLSWSVSSRKK